MCPRNFLPQALAALLRSSTSTPSSVAAAFSTPSSHLSKRHNNFKLGYRKYSPLDTDIIDDTTENNNNISNRPSLEEIEPCKYFDSFGDILPISNNQEKKNTSFDTTTSKSTQEGTIQTSPTEKKKNAEKVVVKDNEQQYDTVINLFDFEENTDAFAAGISSLTWFEGDANSAVEVIRPRIKEILHANPWLLGSLRGSSPMRLKYNANIEPTTSDVDSKVFQFFSLQDTSSLPDLIGKLKFGMDLTEMNQVTQLYDLVLEPSKHLVNTNKPLFKISLVPESSEFKRFALVVSLSHRIADGATFYNLYQMLDPTSKIHAIDPTRKLDVLESIDNLTGKNKDEKGITGTYFKLLFVRDKMRSFLRKSIGLSEGPTFQQRTFLLDKDYINQVKAQHDPSECEFSCPFISTNDVITSTCFNIAKPDKVDKHFGTMSINFKGKVSNLERYDAPNYIHVVIYGEADYTSPQAIRKSISGGNYEPISGSKARRQVNQASNLMKDIHLTICTNWSTFSPKGGLSLGSNVKQLIHLPLKDMRYAPPSLISNLTIFAPWSNDIAVAVSGTQEMVDKFVHHPMVAREI